MNEWVNRTSSVACYPEPAIRFAPPAEAHEEARLQPVSLPQDLREWLALPTMLGWLHEEIERLDAPAAAPAEIRSATADDNSQGLLAVLAFAYLTARFDTEEIARACRTEPVFRYLAEGGAPFVDEIKRFRRENRGLLVTVLSRFLARALQQRTDAAGAWLSSRARRELHEHVVDRLDIARHMEAA